MRPSRRGYVSFLFMAPLALLLLMPLTLQQGPENSLVSMSASDSALAEQVALKRALIRAAQAAILEAQSNVTDALQMSAIVLGAPAAKIAGVTLENIPNEEQKLQAVRYAVLSNWSQTLRLWNLHSGYSASLYCGGPPSAPGAAVRFDDGLDPLAQPVFSQSWQACSQFIWRDPRVISARRPYIIVPGFEIRVESNFFNASGGGPIHPQEVGS